jgi:UDP-GlcNAc:undecaprenyl-phosphate/decaprenyl-phosphate GlcNAc-1-phosphate transferase
MLYVFPLILSIFLSLVFTIVIKEIALRYKLVDKADLNRKFQKKAIPLAGGWAIFLSVSIVSLIYFRNLIVGDLNIYHWLGVFLASLLIMIGGTLDDRYKLKPLYQFIFPIIAIGIILLAGVEISHLSDPFDSLLSLKFWSVLKYLFVVLWLLAMVYSTKLLDGIDGLVSGLGLIAAVIIFLFTSLTNYYQADIAFFSIVFLGASLGFLIFNFSPAKIYLGEGGSLLIGFLLGIISIISGSKIAIALLIMGLPLLDLFWTVIRRLLSKKNPFKYADRMHLHHRLLDLGLSHKQICLLYYSIAFIFGISALFLQTRGKIYALLMLILLMFIIIIFFYYLTKKPKLLFHVCCAPCASYISLNYLKKKYDLSWYFDNSNLVSFEEYEKRLNLVKQVALENNIKLIIAPYNNKIWQDSVKGRETDLEKGKRCHICYQQRLKNAYQLAKDEKYDYFASSLIISPYKDREKIKEIGQGLVRDEKPKFLDLNLDFNDIFKKSIKLAKDNNWYCQKFCGCKYSKF